MFRLRSAGVLSCAKVFGIVHGALGILLGFFFLLIGIISVAFPSKPNQPGAIFFILFAVFAPVMYAVIGFILGAVGAYNLIAEYIGGLELQLDTVALPPAYAPPPPLSA